MRESQAIEKKTEDKESLMDNQGQQQEFIPAGIFHLVFDETWSCVFVSDDCLTLLDCSRENFLETLRSGVVLTDMDGAETSVETILQELADTSGQKSYTGTILYESDGTSGVKGVFISFDGQDGRKQLYGQLVCIGHSSRNLIKQMQNEGVREQETYHTLLHYMDNVEVTVLEAELHSGDFRLLYNSNPDYAVKLPEAAFEEFAQFFGVDRIHPEDRARYMEEIQFCHGEFFEQNIRTHSVYSRMYRPTIGEYQLHEFVTLRMDMEEGDQRQVILICRPVKEEKMNEESFPSEWLEPQVLRDTNRMLKEQVQKSENIFRIVSQHANCILYKYDPITGIMHPWDIENEKRDILSHLYRDRCFKERLEENPVVFPECMEDLCAFFADIHSGIPSGEMKIRVQLEDGEAKWYHFQYTSIFENDQFASVLISAEDITEHHAHEIAYLFHEQSVINGSESHLIYMESCLECDRVEKMSGHLLSAEEKEMRFSYSDFSHWMWEQKFQFESSEEFAQYFSRENLRELYAQGERKLKSEWKARLQDGTWYWLCVEIVMMADPFNGHVKAIICIVDITKEQEEQQMLLQRADYDNMTGLLRRDVGEAKIQRILKERRAPGGILIVLDLDDLKGINDHLGHIYGDRAIIGIADVLKNHFRKDDILIRAGGDEFMAFLPKSGESVGAVTRSVATLLRKLSMISIGEHDERTVRCSIGCAVEMPGEDTFESLYERADKALYHVKANGKNNFAFFEPAMLEANYKFHMKQAQPLVNGVAQDQELKYLLEAVSFYYPGIVLFNLTQDYFRILAVGSNVAEIHVPDKVDVFWENWKENVHLEDWEEIFSLMSRDALLDSYEKGLHHILHYYRNLESTGYVRTEMMVRLFQTEEGDTCAYLFFRWKDEED